MVETEGRAMTPPETGGFIEGLLSMAASVEQMMTKVAKSYAEAGIPIFICFQDKSPATPQGFKNATTDAEQIERWFSKPGRMIGVPMGDITCLDIDAKHQPGLIESFEAACADAGLSDLLARLPKQTTVNDGAHYFCRVTGIDKPIRNKKLAVNSAEDTIIETRGKGGYAIVAPSKGYKFERGSIDAVPEIDAYQWKQIIDVAKKFDRSGPPPESSRTISTNTCDNRPGDDYNKRTDFFDVLRSHGWQSLGNGDRWTRPDKNPAGVSATWNSPETPGKFYVFSSSAAPFEPETSYSPFAVYALLEHGGDFTAATSALRAQGYGEQLAEVSKETQASIESICSNAQVKADDAADPVDIFDLLNAHNVATKEKIAERKKMETESVFAMEGISIVGEWLTIYATYSTGKTLLTIWLIIEAIKRGSIEGRQVYYLNADDTFSGVNEKGQLLEQYGIREIVPGSDGAPNCATIVSTLAKSKNARGKIVILDTLKKFTDLMDKKIQKKFGEDMRRFVQAGGTLIGLAHTNKHKDNDGKAIASGTSDISDDCDCKFILDLDTPKDADDRQVTFTNDKPRGPVEKKVTFKYDASKGKSWIERFNSVQRVSESEAEANVSKLLANEQRKVDAPIIEYITETLLNCGEQSEREIVRNNLASPDNPDYEEKVKTGSKARRTEVLKRYDQTNPNSPISLWKSYPAHTGGTRYKLKDQWTS